MFFTRFIIEQKGASRLEQRGVEHSAAFVTECWRVTRIEAHHAHQTAPLSISVTYDLCGEGTKIDSELSSYDTLLILSRLSRCAHKSGVVFMHEYLNLGDRIVWDYDENDLPLN